jgi:hypothetical protein
LDIDFFSAFEVDAIGVMDYAVENGDGDGGTANHLGRASAAHSYCYLSVQRKHSGLVLHCLGASFCSSPTDGRRETQWAVCASAGGK